MASSTTNNEKFYKEMVERLTAEVDALNKSRHPAVKVVTTVLVGEASFFDVGDDGKMAKPDIVADSVEGNKVEDDKKDADKESAEDPCWDEMMKQVGALKAAIDKMPGMDDSITSTCPYPGSPLHCGNIDGEVGANKDVSAKEIKDV